MKSSSLFAVIVGCVSTALCVMAQPSRDAYRNAYRVWREAEPNLEREAGTLDSSISTRAAHASAEAAKYGSARSAFLHDLAAEPNQDVLWLQQSHTQSFPDPVPSKDALSFAGAATTAVDRELSSFKNDSDRGVQQLRQALEKERSALGSLESAIEDRQKAEDGAAKALDAAEPLRAQALEKYRLVASAITGSASSVEQESAAWSSYYGQLSNITPAPVSALPAPAPVVTRPPSITPLPLARYTGGWTFPPIGGMFHGAEPESIDVVVSVENNHVTGTFSGRFKLPRGTKGDPVVQFDFSGDLRPTRNQVFVLQSKDGAKGTIELIPGNAFNLLEVNFQMDPRQGKIRAADLLLVKK